MPSSPSEGAMAQAERSAPAKRILYGVNFMGEQALQHFPVGQGSRFKGRHRKNLRRRIALSPRAMGAIPFVSHPEGTPKKPP